VGRAHEEVTALLANEVGNAIRGKLTAGFAEPADEVHPFDTIVVPVSGDGITVAMNGKTVALRRGVPFLIPRGVKHQAKSSGAAEVVAVRVN
jgi:quercetin dioxygenase-like cupin family protein